MKHVFRIALALIICSTFFCSQDLSRTRSGRDQAVEVTIKKASRDDLGRGMIFTFTSDMRPMVFIKDFFSASNSPNEVQKKSTAFIRSMERFRNRTVIIRYYENAIGDNIILNITAARPDMRGGN